MTSKITLKSFDTTLRDVYPRAGDRIKQWVVDMRREEEWESETCPVFDIPDHEDNTGALCRNLGETAWRHLDHDCCSTCGVVHRLTAKDLRVVEWLAEKAKRPPIEADHAKYSDEIEPARALAPHPWFDKGKR